MPAVCAALVGHRPAVETLQRPAQIAQPHAVRRSATHDSRQREPRWHQRALAAAPPPHAGRRRPSQVAPRATRGGDGSSGGPGGNWGEKKQAKEDQQLLVFVAVALTVLVVAAFRLGGEAFQDADAYDAFGGGGGDLSFGAGDALGALLWSTSLYYCSPLQLLLLFFGFIETERPSDWVLRRLGLAAGLNVDAIDYRVPLALHVTTIAIFGGAGVGIAFALQALLGDATWAVSTGFGACFGAAMYEVGRPRRLTVEQAQEKEKEWQAFAKFADARLQRSGRCHETEILRALQREVPSLRQLDGIALRPLLRNWHRDTERSSNGFYKGVSLAPAGGSSVAAGGAATGAAGSGSVSSVDQSTDQY